MIRGKFNSVAFVLKYIGEGEKTLSQTIMDSPYSFITTREIILRNPMVFEVTRNYGRKGFKVKLTKFGKELLELLEKYNFKFLRG